MGKLKIGIDLHNRASVFMPQQGLDYDLHRLIDLAVLCEELGFYSVSVGDSLLDIYQQVSGILPVVLPLSTFDITPYGNNLFHINSLMQPATATDKPVVGVAITAQVAVPGCATGASHPTDVALAATYCVEVAKAFGEGTCRFYNAEEYAHAVQLYGSLAHLATQGR
ncbi:MAG: DUF1177 family protein [Deltaproteobacteria bacterium]|nr:DUF1177 family protein [Deltaproteobacteria bacterium]